MKPLAAALAAVMALCILGVAAIVVLAPSCTGPGVVSGRFEIDTVTFELDPSRSSGGLSGIDPPSSGPGIHINTNTQLRGLWGGTVKSSTPYAIGLDYTDNAGDLERLEFTKIEVTYNPGTPGTPGTPSTPTEPAAGALALPMTIDAREVEAVNSDIMHQTQPSPLHRSIPSRQPIPFLTRATGRPGHRGAPTRPRKDTPWACTKKTAWACSTDASSCWRPWGSSASPHSPPSSGG